MMNIKSPKKLIEVALPLDDINVAAAREKSIRHGHPSTLHLWWARRPLAAARAVIFAQMVNDPGYQRELGYGVNKKEAEIKREKLFDIIRDLVKWENTNNEEVLQRARDAIWDSWRETCYLNRNHPQAAELFNPEKLPAFHDPFAGGGAIPLEAQRLGLESYASDLNPVAVMINKAMIEIPPKFAGQKPIGPLPEGEKQPDMMEDWAGARGLAEDVRRYGHWMREEAFKRIGHLYPKVEITSEMVAERPDLKAYEGEKLTVIAWLWARTVKSPSPAHKSVDVPLVGSFYLSKVAGSEAYVEPVILKDSYSFKIVAGRPSDETQVNNGTKTGRSSFVCIMSGAVIDGKYIKASAKSDGLGDKLMAVVLQGKKGRVYISPTPCMEDLARSESVSDKPDIYISGQSQYVGTLSYGMDKFSDLFTDRQLACLNTFSSLVTQTRDKINSDLLPLADRDAEDYANAIAVYLAFAVSGLADRMSNLCSWDSGGKTWGTKTRNTFSRQAISMVWDFAEVNPFSGQTGSWNNTVGYLVKGVVLSGPVPGTVYAADAATQNISENKVVSTDPPYYDNIPYADLSDFFYVWMRKSLRVVEREVFATLATPKDDELVAFAYRHDSKETASSFFLSGMSAVMQRLAVNAHPSFPITIYYAFKQSETKNGLTGSRGWEDFLEAVVSSGLSIDGTWPMKTELATRTRSSASNALASSIILVCRKRNLKLESISRRDFQRQLREEMPEALEAMIGGETGHTPIAPVDLAQSAIGPGMAIYSKYAAVLNQDGTRMSVHDALILINRAISDYLNPDSGSFDADTLFCDDWFAQYGWSAGPFGDADTLARAKGTSVDGAHSAGVIESGAGKVRLLKWSEYPSDWDPRNDSRTPVWEACHQLIRALNQQGESAAGILLARMPEQGEPIRQLAYHLYTLCERKKWAEEARAYNELIGSWHAIVAASHDVGHRDEQIGLEL